MSQDKEREALLLQTVEALRNYVDVIAKAGGGDKMLFMAAMREADDKARAALAAIGPQDFGDLTGVQPCCGDYVNCHRACTPRGRWQATKDREDVLASQQAGKGEPQWREHVDQRIRTWRQRTMNKSGDRLAIDDFMGQDSIDDLVDFVCDEWASPPSREPLTDDAILDAFCHTPGIHQFVQAFKAGARFAERAHGIHSREGGSNDH